MATCLGGSDLNQKSFSGVLLSSLESFNVNLTRRTKCFILFYLGAIYGVKHRLCLKAGSAKSNLEDGVLKI